MAEPLVFDGSPLDEYLQDSLDTSAASSSQLATPDTLTQTSSLQSSDSASLRSLRRPSIVSNSKSSHRSSHPIGSPEVANATDEDFPDDDRSSAYQPSRSHMSETSIAAQQKSSQDASFAERFKLVICSSFLLTSSLSISFYDGQSSNIAATPNTALPAEASTASHQHGTDTSSVACTSAQPCGQTVARHSLVAGSSQPRLDPHGRDINNVASLAAFMLAPFSKTWSIWLQTSLIIICLSWSSIYLLGLSSYDFQPSFELSHRARIKAANTSKPLLSSSQKEPLYESAVQDVTHLVRALQNFDVAVNKAINAVQEVELVSRGFKLTQPLPPISRIEAASGSNRADNLLHTPPRHNALLSDTDRAAATELPSNHKDSARASSLSLGGSRRHKPSRSASVATPVGSRREAKFSLVGDAPPRRLLELRKTVDEILTQASYKCESTSASLDGLIDAEEFTLLKDMYTLDSPAPIAKSVRGGRLDHWTGDDDLHAPSIASPPLDVFKPLTWTSSIPRTFAGNVRQAETPSRTVASPRAGHKRLSLVSDNGSVLHTSTDRANGASSSLSGRSSTFAEHGNASYRSPRLQYISDKSGMTGGPNESAALKRLSYRSVSSAASSSYRHQMRSPSMHSAQTFTATSVMSSPPLPPFRATESNSLLGSHVDRPQSADSTNGRDEMVDRLSLLSMKNHFEAMHQTRRQLLCRLLALQLSLTGRLVLSSGQHIKADVYWQDVCSLIAKIARDYEKFTTTLIETVGREMCSVIPMTSAAAMGTSDDRDLGTVLAVADSSRLDGHPILKDRLNAMMLALRSIQAKIRVCAEDIRIPPPPMLHGSEEPAKHDVQAPDDRSKNIERVLSTMHDDLLALSAEWEGSLQIVQGLHGSSSVAGSLPAESTDALTALQQPMALLESNTAADPGLSDANSVVLNDSMSVIDDDTAADAVENDENDLASLLLGSTSPHALPPPGLEQVFESIAGMAGISAIARKLTREERITQAQQKRQQSANATPGAAERLQTLGMMSELTDVIQSRKAARDQLTDPVSTGSTKVDLGGHERDKTDKSHVLALGSPLDLGIAGREGVFGSLYSSSSQNGARRSVSSLDMARARSRQSLDGGGDDSFSDGFSDDRSRSSGDFSFEATTLESVPEGGPAAELLSDSPSVKSTPRAAQTPQNRRQSESPFDLSAQIAAYARRKAAASTSSSVNDI